MLNIHQNNANGQRELLLTASDVCQDSGQVTHRMRTILDGIAYCHAKNGKKEKEKQQQKQQ